MICSIGLQLQHLENDPDTPLASARVACACSGTALCNRFAHAAGPEAQGPRRHLTESAPHARRVGVARDPRGCWMLLRRYKELVPSRIAGYQFRRSTMMLAMDRDPGLHGTTPGGMSFRSNLASVPPEDRSTLMHLGCRYWPCATHDRLSLTVTPFAASERGWRPASECSQRPAIAHGQCAQVRVPSSALSALPVQHCLSGAVTPDFHTPIFPQRTGPCPTYLERRTIPRTHSVGC